MPYDYQILAAILFIVFGILSVLSAMVDQRRPSTGLALVIIGLGLGYWAWVLSDGKLTPTDVPDAFFRVMARLTN